MLFERKSGPENSRNLHTEQNIWPKWAQLLQQVLQSRPISSPVKYAKELPLGAVRSQVMLQTKVV
jgi:hypothetical protein